MWVCQADAFGQPHSNSLADLMLSFVKRLRRQRRDRTRRSHVFQSPVSLEPRVMLAGDVGSSMLTIHAAGQTGRENMQLQINGETVAQWAAIGGSVTDRDFQEFHYDGPVDLATDDIRVALTNDAFIPGVLDRNLFVDRIVVNGQTLQSESPTVRSTGTWNEGLGFTPGNFQSESLNGNGYLQFNPQSSTLSITAAGSEGTETLGLSINDQIVASFDVSESFQTFTYESAWRVQPDDVKIVFDGDVFDPANGIDTNLTVAWTEIDGVRYQTDSPFVFSDATWSPFDQTIEPGFGRGDTLHRNGSLMYASGSTLSIRAKGDLGVENFDLLINGNNVGTYAVGNEFETFEFIATGPIEPNQVRIEYNSDDSGFAVGGDANLTVDWIEIGDQRFQTEANSTYSFGTGFIGAAVQFGFGHGESLFVNGFFDYQAVVLNPDSFSLPEDSIRVPLAVDANDTRAAGYTADIVLVDAPQNGTAVIVDGVLYYTPDSDFAGTDRLTYNIASLGGSQQKTPVAVDITVNESHQQPQSFINPRVASELTPSGRFLVVEKVAKLPLDSGGRQLRMNSMATVGNRVFIVTDGRLDGEGAIYELVTDADGNTTVELFLDAGAAILANTGLNIDNANGLFGLRSMAFHPEFATNGIFYTAYTGQRPSDPSLSYYLSDPPNPVDADSVLAEWRIDLATGRVDPSSYREVFRVGMIALDHPIRGITFNPFAVPGDEDYGLLYIGHGDGSEQSAIAGDGQDGNALGKILRINPLANGITPFTNPDSNPFINDIRYPSEVYALGFRNPTNLTFARDASGEVRLLVTEIGRDNVEEINVVVKGGNYGWADREGVFVHLRDQFAINGNIANLPANEADNDFIYPVSIFGHEGTPGDTFAGQAITGSHVIANGSTELDGQFIFAEFATDGRAYHLDFEAMLQQTTTLDPNDPNRNSPDDLTWLDPQELTILFDHDNDASTTPLVRASLKDVLDDEPDFEAIPSAGKIRADVRLGQGPNGELYILNKRNGWVYRAVNT